MDKEEVSSLGSFEAVDANHTYNLTMSKKRKLNEDERLKRCRERNRVHARNTRERKKVQLDHLQLRIQELIDEKMKITSDETDTSVATILMSLAGVPANEASSDSPRSQLDPSTNSLTRQYARIYTDKTIEKLRQDVANVLSDQEDMDIDVELLQKDKSACTSDELDLIRRERNRMHAKRTRMRKKKMLMEMEAIVAGLEDEIRKLYQERGLNPDEILLRDKLNLAVEDDDHDHDHDSIHSSEPNSPLLSHHHHSNGSGNGSIGISGSSDSISQDPPSSILHHHPSHLHHPSHHPHPHTSSTTMIHTELEENVDYTTHLTRDHLNTRDLQSFRDQYNLQHNRNFQRCDSSSRSSIANSDDQNPNNILIQVPTCMTTTSISNGSNCLVNGKSSIHDRLISHGHKVHNHGSTSLTNTSNSSCNNNNNHHIGERKNGMYTNSSIDSQALDGTHGLHSDSCTTKGSYTSSESDHNNGYFLNGCHDNSSGSGSSSGDEKNNMSMLTTTTSNNIKMEMKTKDGRESSSNLYINGMSAVNGLNGMHKPHYVNNGNLPSSYVNTTIGTTTTTNNNNKNTHHSRSSSSSNHSDGSASFSDESYDQPLLSASTMKSFHLNSMNNVTITGMSGMNPSPPPTTNTTTKTTNMMTQSPFHSARLPYQQHTYYTLNKVPGMTKTMSNPNF